MVTFSLTVKGQLSQILRFCLLFLQNLNDDPFHIHDKRLFCQITYQIDSLQKRLRKEICCIWAGPPARHTAGLDSSTRAARNARQAARGQHDPAQCRTHRPPPPLFRWETEKCNSANSAESPPAPTSPQASCLPRRDQPWMLEVQSRDDMRGQKGLRIGSRHLQLVECTSSLEKVRPLDSCRALLLFLLLGIFTLHLGDFIHLDDFPPPWFSAGTVRRSQWFWSFNGHDPSISSYFHNFWKYFKQIYDLLIFILILVLYIWQWCKATLLQLFIYSNLPHKIWLMDWCHWRTNRIEEPRLRALYMCWSWIQKSLQNVLWWGAVIFSRSRI